MKEQIYMFLNLIFILGFVFTLPDLVRAIPGTYIALNILCAMAFVGLNSFIREMVLNSFKKNKEKQKMKFKKLNTLNDLNEYYDCYDEQRINNKINYIPERAKVLKCDLKREAIRHIKEISDESERPSICRWIKQFFNITEEELK
jgi:hypothetical protein